MKMEPLERSKTSAFKTQTPRKYPKENILQFLKTHVQVVIYEHVHYIFNLACKTRLEIATT